MPEPALRRAAAPASGGKEEPNSRCALHDPLDATYELGKQVEENGVAPGPQRIGTDTMGLVIY
jgi:hypothetical protein